MMKRLAAENDSLFTLYAHYNDFDVVGPDWRTCLACGTLLDKWDHDLSGLTEVERLPADISITLTGFYVVSDAFKRACEDIEIEGLEFRRFGEKHWWIWPKRVVRFDSHAAGTEFLRPCSTCSECQEVVGPIPLRLIAPDVVGPREIVRTDIEFAKYDGKAPLVVLGRAGAVALRARKLRGAILRQG